MGFLVSHTSAVEYWRLENSATRLLSQVVSTGDSGTLPKGKPICSELELLRKDELKFLVDPVHLLVGSAADRCKSKKLMCHVCSKRFPQGSFVCIGKDLLISSPELCFVQMATILPFPKLVELGYEICGGYTRSPNAGTLVKRDPLTTLDTLEHYIESAGHIEGSAGAKRALRYVIPGSASPMETILTMLLCLPVRLGGYGMPPAKLNYRVDVTKRARKAAAKKFYVCDLYWVDAHLAVEYDSDMFHTGSARIAHDASRRSGLAYLGISVVTVTSSQIFNRFELDRTAWLLSKYLGKRIRPSVHDWMEARIELRRQLLTFPRVYE